MWARRNLWATWSQFGAGLSQGPMASHSASLGDTVAPQNRGEHRPLDEGRVDVHVVSVNRRIQALVVSTEAPPEALSLQFSPDPGLVGGCRSIGRPALAQTPVRHRAGRSASGSRAGPKGPRPAPPAVSSPPCPAPGPNCELCLGSSSPTPPILVLSLSPACPLLSPVSVSPVCPNPQGP